MTGINALGAVSGSLFDGTEQRGFLYSGGVLRLVPDQPNGLSTHARGPHPFLPVVIGTAKPLPGGDGRQAIPFTWG